MYDQVTVSTDGLIYFKNRLEQHVVGFVLKVAMVHTPQRIDYSNFDDDLKT